MPGSPMQKVSDSEVEKVRDELLLLFSLVTWDGAQAFIFRNDYFWYIMEKKLQGILLQKLLLSHGYCFPVLPCIPFRGMLQSNTDLLRLYDVFQESLNLDDCFSYMQNWNISCIYPLDECGACKSDIPIFINEHLYSCFMALELDPWDVETAAVFSIPHLRTLFELKRHGFLSGSVERLLQSCAEILCDICPDKVYGDPFFYDEHGEDGYLLVLFFFTEEGFYQSYMLDFSFFYAMYGLALCCNQVFFIEGK